MREYREFQDFARSRVDDGEFIGPDGPMDDSDIRKYRGPEDRGPVMSRAGWD